jgi:hypothetical protein
MNPQPLALSFVALAGCLALWRAQDAPWPEGATVPSLAQPVDLLAGDDLDEWLFFGEASAAEAAGVAVVEDGVLRIAGAPKGYLATRRWYRDYELEFQWRWLEGAPGNSGLLVHATTPLIWHGWPRCVEVQLQADNAGDFILMADGIGLQANEEATARAGSVPGGPAIDRRVANLQDGLELPLGQWNTMHVRASGTELVVSVNGTVVNRARACTVSEGAIALQSEGTPIEFRNVRLTPLEPR